MAVRGGRSNLLEELPDPRKGADQGSKTSSVDRTKEFAELSEKKPPDIEAERAFLRSKIQLVHLDPNLAEDEKSRFINELQGRLDSLSKE
jgi:hypothetical protein